jgi:hypothetical protein
LSILTDNEETQGILDLRLNRNVKKYGPRKKNIIRGKRATMSTAEVLKGKELADDIRNLAKEMNIDLSKADEKKTENYLRKIPSLSRKIVKMRYNKIE